MKNMITATQLILITLRGLLCAPLLQLVAACLPFAPHRLLSFELVPVSSERVSRALSSDASGEHGNEPPGYSDPRCMIGLRHSRLM